MFEDRSYRTDDSYCQSSNILFIKKETEAKLF